MKNKYLPIVIAIVIFGFVAYMIFSSFHKMELANVGLTPMGSEMIKARVSEIIEDGQIDLGGTLQRYQVARMELIEGEYQGITMEMDYSKRQVLGPEGVGESHSH